MNAQAPVRPALLVVDPDEGRRHALAVGFAEQGYEAVPTVDAEQGRRFAAALGPAVVVAPAALAVQAEGGLLDELRSLGGEARTVLLFGETAADGDELPEDVLYLAIGGISTDELVRRVQLVLIGHEIGAAPDPELVDLVGDLSHLPTLELVRSLARLGVSCRIDLGHGATLLLDHGALVAAKVGSALGMKAFCRLARRQGGPFRVSLGPVDGDERAGLAAIDGDLTALVIEALEDRIPEAPAGRLRIRRTGAPRQADEVARAILSAVDLAHAEGVELTVAALLDRLPFRDGRIESALLALSESEVVDLVEPQARVRVVTDSTADLTQEAASAHGIVIVPLRVYFGEKVLRDGVDVTPGSFYRMLEREKSVHPRTSPPPPEEFLDAYKGLIANADIVSIHLSSKMSLTSAEASKALEAGVMALAALRRTSTPPRIEVVDSKSISLGLGLQAIFAARMAARGVPAQLIVERLASVRERIHILFVVDTLEYLARGGRIGHARALLGGLLGIKPILGVVGGEVTSIDKVRGGRKAHPRILELLRERIDPQRPVVGGVAHANAPMWADRLRGLLMKDLKMTELFMAEMGPVVGTHTGPGTVGAAIYQPVDDEELALLSPLEG